MQTVKKSMLGGKILDGLVMVALSLLMLLAFGCFFAAAWYVKIYGRIGFDSIIYTLTCGLGGVSPVRGGHHKQDAFHGVSSSWVLF